MGRRRQNDGDELELGMTPFVDVVFSLLIFFVVTARFVPPEMRIPMFLDRPAKAEQFDIKNIHTRPFTIEIACTMDGSPATARAGQMYFIPNLDGLKDELLEYKRQNSKGKNLMPDARVVIKAKGDVVWQDVISVIDIARELELPVGMPASK